MADSPQQLRVAITLGDPAGIGPEIALRAAASPHVWKACSPVLVGSQKVCEHALESLPLDLTLAPWTGDAESDPEPGIVRILVPGELAGADAPKTGGVSEEGGRQAYAAIDEAVRRILGGELDALCTAPISKAALNLAGHRYPGHTEMLAEKAGAPQVAMLMVGGGVRVVPATIHCPLREVPQRLSTRRLIDLLRLIHRSMPHFGIDRPRLAVCGLNPHAGEGGLLGDEEQTLIDGAVETCRTEGLDVHGPVPADVVFHQMLDGRWDCILAMYHDQAMIPVKTLAFDRGVNVTLGLPFVRTSPDHGTAFDIAGSGRARPDSLIAAVQLAADLTRNRRRLQT